MAMSKVPGLALNSTIRQTFPRMWPNTASALRFMKRDKTYEMLSRSRIRRERGRGMVMAMSEFRESASSSSAEVEIDEALNQLSDEIDETLQNLSVPVQEEEKAEFWEIDETLQNLSVPVQEEEKAEFWEIDETLQNLSVPVQEEEKAEFWDGQQAGGAEEEENRERRRKEVEEAINKVLDEDIDEAIDKYGNLGHELYAKIDFAWINAFAERAFGGNPAVVCYLPYETESEWMQLVAREFNVSETAFLVRRRASNSASKFATEKTLLEMDESGKSLQPVTRYFTPPPPKNVFYLRWFTPKVEVDLCGHATLAAAHLLFETGIVEDDTVVFHTKSGVLKARKVKGYDEPPPKGTKPSKQQSRTCLVELDFPIVSVSKCESVEVEKLSDVLGNDKIVWAGKTSAGNYLVEVPSSGDVKLLKPHFEKMLEFEGHGGLIVTSAGEQDSEFDFISRYFCPKAGVTEDPVTGSAHCALGPYWADKLQKDTLEAYQASERGGRVSVKVNKVKGRVSLQGSAVLVMMGTLVNSHSGSS
uniref:TSA: Wollemia nobilis Ref_Wollemi_Transcript_11410_1993 transcribed RNA sequence n=1 Tax=Wollemia nobilis TaxID=56998 RepID=A0A0C9QSP6_9CONI